MGTISVVINTCNEAAYIEDCLQSVAWADEIVVIDMESTDTTVEICRKYTANIIEHTRVPAVEMVREFGIRHATCDWVLVLDPDERVSRTLSELLRAKAVSDDADGYVLRFQTCMFGREIRHSGWGGDEHLRFFRAGTVTWPGHVHSQPTISGRVETVAADGGYVEHINYLNVAQFIEKMNRYTSLEACRLHDGGRPFHWLKLFYQPGKEFINRFIVLKGYKDGFVGLVLALMMAFYVQASYIKLWELCKGEERHDD